MLLLLLLLLLMMMMVNELVQARVLFMVGPCCDRRVSRSSVL